MRSRVRPQHEEEDAGRPVFSPIQYETLELTAGARNYNQWMLERGLSFVGERVLDVGAGIGTFSDLLGQERDVVALEPDESFAPTLATRFNATSNVTVVETAVEEFEPEAPFDTIICFNVLEHIDDDEGAIRHFHRLLVPGGTLLLLVPAHPLLYGTLDAELHHARRYRTGDVRRLLTAGSFAPQRVRYVNPFGAVGWLVAARLLRRRTVPPASLRTFDRLVPLLRRLDRVPTPFGLSVWAVAHRVAPG